MSFIGGFSIPPDEGIEPQPPESATGRMISLRFVTSVLRRRRRIWIGLAALGLVIGGGYHSVVPPTYRATSTVYLAHPSGSNDEVVAANDLAMVKTLGVGQRAVALLGEPGLSAEKLLGSAPAVEPSDNLLVLTIAGPTPEEAVRRVDAVTKAYLAFRAEQYDAQNRAVISGTNRQIEKLRKDIERLGKTSSASVIAQRANLESQITNLQQTVQTDNLATQSISEGSRVLTAGTLVVKSKKKEVAIDAASGLIGGLGIGLIVVILQGVLSDRLWRREDVAGVLGAPVGLSVTRSRRRRRLSIKKQAEHPGAELLSVTHYLHDRLSGDGSRRVGMVVALDDVRPAAAAVAALAGRLSNDHRHVVVVDATAGRRLAGAFGLGKPAVGQVRIGRSALVSVVSSPDPWETDRDGGRWEWMRDELAAADALLVVATVEPAYGAEHLRRWAGQATVTVTAGRCSAERLGVTAELLDAAGISVSSAVLFGAEASDESIGLPDPYAPGSARQADLVEALVRDPR